VNVLVPVGLVIAGLLLNWWALLVIPVAIVLYGLLAGFTLFDARESRKVLAAAHARPKAPVRSLTTHLPPALATPLETAITEERKIEQAIEDAELPFEEVSVEVRFLLTETEKVAQRGAVIDAYLTDPDVAGARNRLRELKRRGHSGSEASEAHRLAIEALESQVEIQAELGSNFERCCAELEHLAASLGVIRGQIIRMRVAEDASVQDELAGEVRGLRERITAVAEGLADATSQLDRKLTV
jgi:hypothetical protein